jgi:hypothetical protein
MSKLQHPRRPGGNTPNAPREQLERLYREIGISAVAAAAAQIARPEARPSRQCVTFLSASATTRSRPDPSSPGFPRNLLGSPATLRDCAGAQVSATGRCSWTGPMFVDRFWHKRSFDDLMFRFGRDAR